MRVIRRFSESRVWLLVAVCGGWVVAGELPSKGVEEWLEELGDEKFAVREEAQLELWKRGEEVLPRLRELAELKQEPERMLRARDLIRKIELEVEPDSDPMLVDWIERYQSATVGEKEEIMRQMRAKMAWFPMLRLYHAEKDGHAKARLRPMLEGAAVRAARDQLGMGDAVAARMALEMAPVDTESMLALAVFYRSRGVWQEEWDRLGEKGRSGAMGLAMLRAAGRLGEARVVAERLGEVRLAAWMAALEGDPTNMMGVVNPEMDEYEKEYVAMARRRWHGEELKASDLERVVKRANGRERSARMAAIQSLFLLAKSEEAESAFAKHSPVESFVYFDQMENVQQALSVMGLDVKNPDYSSWFRSKLDDYRRENFGDMRGEDELLAEIAAMAGFLESRGLDRELWDAFSGPLLQYAKEDEMQFLDLISRMFGGRGLLGGAPLFCVRVAEKWVGEKEERWAEVMTCALGDEGEVRVWWDWLGEQKPALGGEERLRALLAIYRVGADVGGVRERWVERIVKLAKEDPEWAKRARQLAMEAGDASMFVEAEAGMDEETREGLFWAVRVSHLSAMGRWAEAVGVIERHVERRREAGRSYVGDFHAHAYLAAALRMVGREKEAEVHDRTVESMYLGDPAYALRIGYGYAFGRDYQRALVWWKRACVESDSDYAEYVQAWKALADAWMDEGEWERAASLYECMARLFMYSDKRWENPLQYVSYRLHADTARAVSRVKTDRAGAVAMLERCHAAFSTNGALADVFYPSLRRVGLKQEHDRWFGKTWALFREVIKKYPKADNTRNTAAWMSSRAGLNLEEGLEDVKVALARRPGQAAYLDTMAELYFAMGNRAESVKRSTQAMLAKPDDLMIRKQHARFLSEPLPR